ncbi:hypothetical protein CC78DRAFT_544745 [Lojkania enalia]|uniref:polynucleotide adenylyltransferase n=1 Tax=Lojkania enalia TaxID=147567 RepID=A0A9P4N3P9_9PLEO|nr:hypothetical protein CC78DRAFT_544745 [Didymosphaeria enalia]
MVGDSYRPGRSQRNERQNVPSVSRVSFGGDSYRPGRTNGQNGQQEDGQRNATEFIFSSGRPGPQFPPPRLNDANRPPTRPRRSNRGRGPHSSQAPTNRSFNPPRGPGQAGRHGGNGIGRRALRPFRALAPHERPLLQADAASTTELVLGVANGSNKFLDIDDLSEGEAEMDLDSDKGASDAQHSSHKKARLEANGRADGDSVPKWSNPDPYTVLPPPDETTGKKRDFVALIRKAKKEAAETKAGSNAVTANDDFISFDDEDLALPPPPPPPPPQGTINDLRPPPPPPPFPPNNHALAGSLNDVAAAGAMPDPRNSKRSAEAAGLPARPQHPGKPGKRKRGEFEGALIHEWLPDPYGTAAPWSHGRDYSHLTMTQWLHNEILDFYDYVKPSTGEKEVRENLIKRVEQCLSRGRPAPYVGHVRCFGSFPAGLYLPTADMDMVYVSHQHDNGGAPMIDFEVHSQVNRTLRNAARKLESHRIATDVVVITRAKVPIIKFRDVTTGIKVDLSFENLSGVKAQQTFSKWKRDYPDMPYMVALVKQFLLMRGLNDVHTGGLGGFSIICLVVSLIQLQPHPSDLGTLFLNFLNFYGNKFDLARKRIQMHPPKHIDKTVIGIDGRQEKPNALSIADPNQPNNNISGGSSKVKEVFRAFSDAHIALQERMDSLQASKLPESILETILGGDYSSYVAHRAHIQQVK